MFWLLTTFAQVLAALSAGALRRRVREHAPVALALGVLAVKSILRAGLNATILFPPGPYHGWARVAFHVDQALYLLSPAAVAWLALAVLHRDHPAPSREATSGGGDAHEAAVCGATMGVCFLWLLLSAAVAALYPTVRGDALRRVYLEAALAALAVALLAVAAWLRRGAWRSPSTTAACVLAIVGVELAMLIAGPWRAGLFGSAWRLEQAGLLALYPALTIAQTRAWMKAGESDA